MVRPSPLALVAIVLIPAVGVDYRIGLKYAFSRKETGTLFLARELVVVVVVVVAVPALIEGAIK